ncbi:hypothetical protein C7B76_02270 [filamentous cyanobacterium CCP2]|nr:hypothetical protein C7B76_02270 [filamentous cyanobacterium CCP2]
MRKGSDAIGKEVVTYDTGKKIKRIQDLIFDQERNQLLGFLVEEKGLFRDAKVIPLSEVQAIGLNAIVVHSSASVVESHEIPAIQKILHHNNVLRGTRILTTEGLDLGGLVDLFFNEQSGQVEGYEVSGGMFADAYSGRSFVPAIETLHIGDDVAFVPPETAQMMREQIGGIRGAVQATEDRLQAAAQTANDQLQSSAQTVNRSFQEASQNVGIQLHTSTGASSTKLQRLNRDAAISLTNSLVDPVEQKMHVMGRSVDRDVLNSDGSVLVFQGEKVTPTDADIADRLGILDLLYRATGGSLTVNLSQNLQAVSQSVNEQIQTVTQRSSDVFQGAVNKLADDMATEQAKGRRVLKTVRAEDGLIVAAPGQIVTDSVIDRVRTYNKEADLLDAVGLTLATSIRSNASDTWLETKVQLRDRASYAQKNFSTFWHRLQQKVEEWQGRSTQEIKQQRIEQALGRPVTRVILDLEDNVILNVGELITHRAIHQAEASQVLNILLSSVCTKEPEISAQELRASEHGKAALEHDGNGRSPLEAAPQSY